MVAYKATQFKQLEYYSMNFLTEEKCDFLCKENVGQILVLQSRTTDNIYVVANIHVIFNMNRGDIKFFQLALLMRSIQEVQQRLILEHRRNVYVLWGGDFNSAACSPLYNFIRYHEVAPMVRITPSSWSGQYSVKNIHLKLKSHPSRKLQLIGEVYDDEKHGRYCFEENRPLFFEYMAKKLSDVQITFDKENKKATFKYPEGYQCPTTPIAKEMPVSDLNPFDEDGENKKALRPKLDQTREELEERKAKMQAGFKNYPKLQSAYGEDFIFRHSTNYVEVNKYNPGEKVYMTGEMAFSTMPVQNMYPYTVDFVWFGQDGPQQDLQLQVEQVLGSPGIEHLDRCVFLPNSWHASDHFPGVVDFALCQSSK